MQLHPAEQLALDAARIRDQRLRGQGAQWRRSGVVHTPPELARFVARALDELLITRFALVDGLADRSLQIVDPASGPGAFLAAVMQVCAGRGRPPAHLLGADIDPEAVQLAAALRPYAPALELLKTDTLRDATLQDVIAARPEALVLLGNPPWTVSASQPTAAMQTLLEDFRRDGAGVRLPEKKLGVLSDAYVRFFRWAAEVARLHPAGALLGLVTNGSFLDGPVHRGMRAALARWFDEVLVLDLGGSAVLGRSAAKTSRDDNVFGVRPSVAVTFAYRSAKGSTAAGGRVHYARLHGTKAEKLARLSEVSLFELPWTALDAEPAHARFVPTYKARGAYSGWPSLAAWMPFQREGVQSNRDELVIDADKARLLERLQSFAQGRTLAAFAKAELRLPHYDPERARAAVAHALALDPDGTRGISVRRIAYRAFDERWFAPIAPLCHRPRPELLAAFDRSKLALLTVRKDRGQAAYAHFGAARYVVDSSFLSTRSSCRTRAFPSHGPRSAENLAPELRLRLVEELAVEADGHSFVCYALAVLASPTYRERFDEALRLDYPRIPLPPSKALWIELVDAGAALAEQLTAALDPARTAERLERIPALLQALDPRVVQLIAAASGE